MAAPKRTGPAAKPTRRKLQARAQRLEMLIGILGFFTVVALVQAIVVEVRGQNAVKEALILAVFAGTTWFVISRRRSIKL